MKATVHVTLKAGVLDPQGKAIQRAAASLGYERVQDVRQGKVFEVSVDADDEATARKLVEELAGKLLANPVIEDWRIVSLEPGG